MADNVNVKVTRTVEVTGAGFKHTVDIEGEETVAEALGRIGVDAEKLGVDLLIDGERKAATDVKGDDLGDKERIAAPPKQAALGHRA